MTWASPTSPQQPPPTPDRRRTARPVAAWLAATGGTLLLTAAVIVVAGNWQDIAPGAKFVVLLAATAGLGVAAERYRAAVPASARAVAHLAAALAAPVGIAALAVVGGTWPGCVIAGGMLGFITCIVQARRWRAPLLESAAVVAVGLALVGLAAVTALPVGVLGAVAAGLMLAARREAGAAALGLAGAAAPFLTVLAERRIGPGTLDRIGATGPELAWGAPLAGFLAAGVLAAVATRRAAAPLAAAALAAPLIGVVTGLSTRGVDAVVWACLPGLTLIGLETVLAAARTEPWAAIARPLANCAATFGAALAVPLPGAVALARAAAGDVAPLPIVIAGTAVSMSALRLGRDSAPATGLVLAGVGSVAIGLSVAMGWPLLATSVTAAAAAVVLSRGRRLPPVVTAAGWSIAFLGVARLAAGRWEPRETFVATVVAGVVAALAIELWLKRRAANDRPDLMLTAIVAAGALLVGWCYDLHQATAFAVALAGGVIYVAARRPDWATSVLVTVTWVGVLAAVAPGPDGEPALGDDWFGLGITAMALAAAVVWARVRTLWVGHLTAVLTVAAVPYALAALGATAADRALALIVAGVVLTGCSIVVVRSGPLASAGLAASLLAGIVAAMGAAPLLVSLAATCGGLQCLLEGAIRGNTELTRAGATLTAAGVAGTWLTSGANAAVLRWLAPHGVTGEDLAVAIATAVLFGVGAYAGRRRPLSSWATAGPGGALASTWLLGAQFTREAAWSVPLALAGGVVAIGVGGWRRSAAPLLLGTVTVAATVVASAGPRLAELGSWVWLTAGGIALIGLAVVVERAVSSDDGDMVDWARLRDTWR